LKRDFESFDKLFVDIMQTNLSFFLLGDFNLLWNYIVPLSNMLIALKLTQVVNTQKRGNNLLDLIITNIPQNIIETIVPDFLLADHKLTFCITSIKKPKVKTSIMYRPLDKISKPSFVNSLDS